MKLLAALVMVAACSPMTWKHTDQVTLIVSNATIVADAIGTGYSAYREWPGREEIGMPTRQIVGATPSAPAVGVYFAGAIVLNTALWYMLPRGWRSVVPGMIIGAQSDALARNYASCGWCPVL